MKKSIYILLITGAMIFTSCEDFFETTLDLDPPEHLEQLVIQGFADTTDDELNVLVTKTAGLLTNVNEGDLRINDAEVVLIHDGVEYELAPVEEESRYNYLLVSGTVNFEEGETYSLKVTAAGFEEASAQSTVPYSVSPSNITFDEDGPTTVDDDYSEISMFVKDPSEQNNFYELKLLRKYQNGTEVVYSDLYADVFDVVIEEGIANLIIKDESFNGEEKIVELFLSKWYFDGDPDLLDNLYLLWRTISEDQYKYSKSLEQHQLSADNPFATPVQVYSNIENGIGLFAIYNEEKIKIN